MLSVDRILLPTDFSDAAYDAERRARALARLFGADLHVLHVTKGDELSELPRRLASEDETTARRFFRHVSTWLGDDEGLNAEPSTPTGTSERILVRRSVRRSRFPHQAILEYAREYSVGIIVIGTSGQGRVRGPILGSVADRVVRRAQRPVVTVHPDVETDQPPPRLPDDDPSERLIVVPVELPVPSDVLISSAKYWADTFQSSVDFVHVLEGSTLKKLQRLNPFGQTPPQEAAEAHRQLETRVREAAGPDVDAEVRIFSGEVTSTLVDYAAAQQARLILMTTQGMGGVKDAVLGGTTDAVVRSSPCPVCTLPKDGRSLVHTDPRRPLPATSNAPAETVWRPESW